jgi:hypothetical protein
MTEQLAPLGGNSLGQDDSLRSLSGLERAKEMAINGFYTGVVAFEMLPFLDEGSRAAAATATQAALDNPYATSGVAAAATFAIEATSAVATSRLLSTQTGQRLARKINGGLERIGLSNVRTNRATEAAAALAIGVPLTLALKQQQDPARTERENRRFGVRAAAGVSAAVGTMTLLAAEGVSAVEGAPEKIAVGALAVGGLVALGHKLRKYIQAGGRGKSTVVPPELTNGAIEAAPRYDLTDEELGVLEAGIVDKVRRRHGSTICAVWLSSHSPEANFIRTHENRTFEGLDIPELFANTERESAFLAMVDTRKGAERVIRGTRISSPQFNKNSSESSDGTHITMLEDMLDSGQIEREELEAHYSSKKIDLSRCISVETNLRIGERAPRRFGMIPMADLSYLALYKYVAGKRLNAADAAIFAHTNSASNQSLRRLGVDMEPLAGRPDLHTPDGHGGYDDKFQPIAMLNTRKTRRVMRRLALFAPHEMQL